MPDLSALSRLGLVPNRRKQLPVPAIAAQIQRDLLAGSQRRRVIRIGAAQQIHPALVEPVSLFKPDDSRPALALGVNEAGNRNADHSVSMGTHPETEIHVIVVIRE